MPLLDPEVAVKFEYVAEIFPCPVSAIQDAEVDVKLLFETVIFPVVCKIPNPVVDETLQKEIEVLPAPLR
jgi:hypothetical protein